MDRDREHRPDAADPHADDTADTDDTATRPALADDLLEPAPYADDDLLADEEFLSPGARKPSRLTRILVALLICAVGVLIGVQLGKLAGGPASPAAGAAGTNQSRRSGSPEAGSRGNGSTAPRSGLPSAVPAAEGTVSSVRAHTLVVADQGASRTVTFTDDTAVTKAYGHGAIVVGDAVTVSGSRAADGSVNATSIVVK